MPKLTILTTTYNRAYLLHKCFESLYNQTCTDFEWLIIDDGSTDNTEEIVESIVRQKNRFSIKYVKKQNGGKHTALNYSHQHISGKYLLMLDDDDRLTKDAVETVLNDWAIYDDNETIGCISYQKADLKTYKPLVEWKGKKPIVSNTIDFRVNPCRNGDCAEVVRTKVFIEYPAPIFEGENFLAEDFLWINSAYKYDTVYIRKIIYLCEYRTDGLTNAKSLNRLKNPMGGMYTCNLYFDHRFSLRVQIKKAILYDCYALATINPVRNLKRSKSFIKCLLLLPEAWLIYRSWLNKQMGK